MPRGPLTSVPSLIGHELHSPHFLVPQLSTTQRLLHNHTIPSDVRASKKKTDHRASRCARPPAHSYACKSPAANSFLNISSFIKQHYASAPSLPSDCLGRRGIQSESKPVVRRTWTGPHGANGTSTGIRFKRGPYQLSPGRQTELGSISFAKDRKKLRREYLNAVMNEEDGESVRKKYNIRDGYSWAWVKGFAIVNSVFDTESSQGREIPELLSNPDCRAWISALWGKKPTRDELISRWREGRPFGRKTNPSYHKQFVEILLRLLDNDVERALQFIDITTAKDSAIPSHVIADALEYIADICRLQQRHGKPYTDVFIPSFWRIWQQNPNLKYRLSTSLLLKLELLSTTEQATILHDQLLAHKVPIFPNVQLRLAGQFARLKQFDRCLRALQRAFEAEIDPNTPLALGTCTTIMRNSIDADDTYDILSEITSYLLGRDLRFNLVHYNVIMLSATRKGDLQTVFETFNMLEPNGMEPDAYSYAILLQACKKTDDPELYHGLAKHCAEKAMELRSPYVATQYLHYLYTFHKRQKDTTIFKLLLQEFTRYFSIEPLQTLGIVENHELSHITTDPMDSCIPAIHILIAARLEETKEQDAHAAGNWLYRRYLDFRAAVDSGHEVLGPLVETDYTYNSFLQAWCNHATLLKHSSQIIQDMVTPLSKYAIHQRAQRPLIPAPPSAISWNILLEGFMKHNQPAAAEKVLELMRQRGFEATEVTYDSLLKGYARLQDVEKSAAVICEAQASGIPMDVVSRAVGPLRNRSALATALRMKYKSNHDDQWSHMPSTEAFRQETGADSASLVVEETAEGSLGVDDSSVMDDGPS